MGPLIRVLLGVAKGGHRWNKREKAYHKTKSAIKKTKEKVKEKTKEPKKKLRHGKRALSYKAKKALGIQKRMNKRKK